MDIIDLPDEPGRPRRQKTALEQIQESLKRHLAPLRQWEDMQDLIKKSSPEYQLREMLKRYEPHWQLQEILDKSTLPKDVQYLLDNSSIGAYAQRMLAQHLPKDWARLNRGLFPIAADLTSVAEAVNAYERELKPSSVYQELLENLERQALGGLSVQDFARQFDQANLALTTVEATKRSLDSLWKTFEDVDFSKFEPNEKDEQEAQQVVQAITQKAGREPGLGDAVDQIIAAITSQKNLTVKAMLLWLLWKSLDMIANGIVGAFVSQQMYASAPQSPQEATKCVKEVARAIVPSPEMLTEYRFVSARMLIVRQNPKARSPELGQLTFGKTVKLLKQEKDFALVYWTDRESGAEIQGWVFSRYLKRFN